LYDEISHRVAETQRKSKEKLPTEQLQRRT
jgi:hypothetical protein